MWRATMLLLGRSDLARPTMTYEFSYLRKQEP